MCFYIQAARSIAKKVARHTDNNDHTAAAMVIACAMNLPDELEQLHNLRKAHKERGHILPQEITERKEITLRIFGHINKGDQTGEATAILDRCL